MAGCVGQSQANSNCTAVYSSEDDLETTSICCNDDKCNNGTYLYTIFFSVLHKSACGHYLERYQYTKASIMLICVK